MLLFASLVLSLCAFSYAQKSYVISHSLNGREFIERQVVSLSDSSVDLRGEPISDALTNSFKTLLRSDDLYTIRISSTENQEIFATSSIHACDLQKSGFKEDITIHVARDGSVMGIQYTSPVTALPRPCNPDKIPDGAGVPFVSRIRAVEPISAQSIPIQTQGPRPPYLQDVRLGVEDAAEEEKKKASNQSFFMKYWYIIVPVLLMSLLSGGGEPPPADGQTAAAPGGGAAGATSTAAGGAAPVSAAGGSAKSNASGAAKSRK